MGVLDLFEGQLRLDDVLAMTRRELEGLVAARIRLLKKRSEMERVNRDLKKLKKRMF